MPQPQPAGDLAKVTNHDASTEYPTMVEVVAYFGPTSAPRKGRRRSIEIPADQFFGFGRYGAPISGDALIAMIDRLRKSS